uniref:Uncharacterized protein n=1 Tax=Meloidogyne hapla TaxID=6305 RepID=A0A1I8B3B4_MELHA
MLVRCLPPMELDTGPWIKKSSTLCSLLLLTIAAFAVPGQANSEEVGFGKHTKTGDNVTLADNTEIANPTNFNLTDCKIKELYPDACDVTFGDGYIELRYNYGSKGCTVDLLSKLNNTIKFTTGVRNTRGGGINKCLDETTLFEESYNNTLPFVYSVNNKDIEKLNNRQNNVSMTWCKPKCQQHGNCMLNTSLQVSWSKYAGEFYAHTYLSKMRELNFGEEKGRGKSQYIPFESETMILELEIKDKSGFTMDFAKKESFDASDGAICVHEPTPLFEPKAWTITDGKHSGKQLLVFSLLHQNASIKYDGKRIIEDHPNGPQCELFVRFDLNDYSLLFVDTSTTTTAPTTTTTATTTKVPTKEATSPEATTDPFSSSTTTLPATTESSSNRTTSRTTTKCPECQEECSGGLYILGIGLIAVSFCICVILVWLCMKDKAGKEKKAAEKQEAERGGDERLQALYKAEAKIKGPKKIGTFSAWKKDRKENETKTAVGQPSIEDEIAAVWKKVEKEKARDKMQYLGEQFMKHMDKELFEREYQPELKMKGLRAVGSFEDWKKKKNIATTFTLTDVTRTAIEYEEPKVVEKVIIETVKADEFTLEEKDHLPLSGEEEGVSVPKSEEEEEVDIRDIPKPVDDTPKVTLDI